jgi:hypothetical protein
VVALGGSYSDVVQAIQQAADNGNLRGRVVYDAIPKLGRTYHREPSDLSADDAI